MNNKNFTQQFFALAVFVLLAPLSLAEGESVDMTKDVQVDGLVSINVVRGRARYWASEMRDPGRSLRLCDTDNPAGRSGERGPREIYERKDKMGFPVPLAEWVRGPLRDFVADHLLSDRARHTVEAVRAFIQTRILPIEADYLRELHSQPDPSMLLRQHQQVHRPRPQRRHRQR